MPSPRSRRPAVPMLTPAEIKAVTNLPASEAVWVGGRRPMPDSDLGTAVDACFWVDAEAKDVRVFEMVPRNQEPDALLHFLVDAMCDPDDDQEPVRPAAVGSDDTRLTEFLAPVEIEVRQAPTMIIDQLFDAMLDMLNEGIGSGYLEREGVTAETVGRFFRAADALEQRAPWTHVFDQELVRIDGLRSHPVFVSLDGADADEPAIALFDNEADALALVERAEEVDPDTLPPYLVFTYEESGVELIEDEAEAHDWPVGPAGVPVLMRSSERDEPLAGEADLALAAEVFEVLASLDPKPRQPVDLRVGTARLVWPHNGLQSERYAAFLREGGRP